MRLAMTYRATVVALLFGLIGGPVLAADVVDDKAGVSEGRKADPLPPKADATALAGGVDWSLPPVHFGPATRGAVLPALYGSYAALQVFDAYTTLSGVRRGALEGNAVMSGMAANSAAVWGVKAGVTVSAVMISEHLWKQHRRGQAIAVMLAANGVMAGVAARNAAVLRTVR
jgi:hypothetical protein